MNRSSLFVRIAALVACLFACVVVAGCAFEEPTFKNSAMSTQPFDLQDSFDIYVDSTGPNGFFVQVEDDVVYTSQEDYERDAPALFAQAAQAGLPVRFVYGPKMARENSGGIQPKWTVPFEAFGYYVTISSPKLKPVSGCISQMAFVANLRIHRYNRAVDKHGVQLRDYHLGAWKEALTKRICVGLVETERGYPNWCSCPGTSLQSAYRDFRTDIQRGLQDAGMNMTQATIFAVAMAPIVILAFSPVGL